MEPIAPRTGEFDAQLRCALLAVLGGRPTPEQSLLPLQSLYPERLIVHPKRLPRAAAASAHALQATTHRARHRLFDVVARDAVTSAQFFFGAGPGLGAGDGEARGGAG